MDEGVAKESGMWFGKEQNARDVVLLGAGFSKAVSDHFPLMPELGQCALDEASIPAGLRPPKSTNFEAWLSRISEDQPYRSVEENLGARCLVFFASFGVRCKSHDLTVQPTGVSRNTWGSRYRNVETAGT